jgi:hypothetical protein
VDAGALSWLILVNQQMTRPIFQGEIQIHDTVSFLIGQSEAIGQLARMLGAGGGGSKGLGATHRRCGWHAPAAMVSAEAGTEPPLLSICNHTQQESRSACLRRHAATDRAVPGMIRAAACRGCLSSRRLSGAAGVAPCGIAAPLNQSVHQPL